MSRYIDADALYERLKADEELARDRVIDTPNSFPNGAVNPCAIRYMAQLCERTRLKEMVYDAPTVDPVKRGKWIKREEAWRNGIRIRIRRCSNCCGAKPLQAFDAEDEEFKYCPWCGAHMVMGDE